MRLIVVIAGALTLGAACRHAPEPGCEIPGGPRIPPKVAWTTQCRGMIDHATDDRVVLWSVAYGTVELDADTGVWLQPSDDREPPTAHVPDRRLHVEPVGGGCVEVTRREPDGTARWSRRLPSVRGAWILRDRVACACGDDLVLIDDATGSDLGLTALPGNPLRLFAAGGALVESDGTTVTAHDIGARMPSDLELAERALARVGDPDWLRVMRRIGEPAMKLAIERLPTMNAADLNWMSCLTAGRSDAMHAIEPRLRDCLARACDAKETAELVDLMEPGADPTLIEAVALRTDDPAPSMRLSARAALVRVDPARGAAIVSSAFTARPSRHALVIQETDADLARDVFAQLEACGLLLGETTISVPDPRVAEFVPLLPVAAGERAVTAWTSCGRLCGAGYDLVVRHVAGRWLIVRGRLAMVS